ncbi:MAG: ion transporter [Oscillospiraceae bacterium]|nr:ion transporter [Oscillospiraceae bacterium]
MELIHMRKRIFEIIQIGQRGDLPSTAFDFFIVANITLNLLAMFLETFSELEKLYPLFTGIEAVTVIFFCIEYVLRIWTADLLYPGLSRRRAVGKFLLSYDGIVDLLTILPFFYLSGFIVFRMLRVVRIFHLFRINAQYDSFNIIVKVLAEKKNQILSSLFIILVLTMASGVGIYNAEHNAQPDVFANAFSGIWWSVSTLLTVGYGDIYPITVIGRIMAIIIAFLGVGAVAIPTGIISAGFVEQYSKNQNSDRSFTDIKKIGEISASEENGLAGLTVQEIEQKYDMRVIVLLRGELTLITSGELTVMAEDILVVNSDKLINN